MFPNENGKEKYFSLQVVLPCNLQRMIWNAQKINPLAPSAKTDLNPVDCILKVQELSSKLIIVPGDDRLSKEVGLE